MNNNIKDKKLYNLNHSEYIINNSDDKRKGNIIILDNFFIPQLNRYRRIQIYLPPDYEASDTCYPSLYLHDGQFAFHNQELNIDDIINKLFWSNETKGVIVIAIENDPAFRREEYNPIRIGETYPVPATDSYAEFIVNTLKPFIDNNFRTKPGREYTGIAGISAGAACSVYIGLKYQHLFSKIGAFSFTMMQSVADNLKNLKILFTKKSDMKIYMDIGRNELKGIPAEIKDCFVKDFVFELNNFYSYLIGTGFHNNELKLVIDDNGEHTHTAVAARFPDAFLWLYEK